VLITGGTGGLGRAILASSRAKDVVLRAQSRRAAPRDAAANVEWVCADLASGVGVWEAVAGVDAIIHAASDSRNAEAVDVEGTRRLVDAARAQRVRHVVFISIVGIDQIPFAYYQKKLAAESIVMSGGVPYSVLRATQFHSLVDGLISTAARMPLVIPLPTAFMVQSVATSEVADRLVQALVDGPGGRLRDLGGPEVMTLGEAAAVWKDVTRVTKPVVSLPLPGRVAAAFRAGKNTAPDGERGTIRWRDWLIHGRRETSPPSTAPR